MENVETNSFYFSIIYFNYLMAFSNKQAFPNKIKIKRLQKTTHVLQVFSLHTFDITYILIVRYSFTEFILYNKL